MYSKDFFFPSKFVDGWFVTFGSLTHLEFIFVEGMMQVIEFFFYSYMENQLSQHHLLMSYHCLRNVSNELLVLMEFLTLLDSYWSLLKGL